MLILLSPAKRLNEENKLFFDPNHAPLFQSEAVKVNNALKKLSAKKLMDLQSISADLAAQNRVRNINWNMATSEAVYQQAVYMFNGDAYLGLDAATLNKSDVDFAQNHLRILSGLYGLLKPLDYVEPYRLEMGTSLKIGRQANLYAFWKKKITALINTEFKDQLIVNLSSKEYASAVDFKSLKNHVVDVEFKDRNSAGVYKVMSFYAKKARGMMCRYIIENRLENADELLAFNTDGYTYSVNDSDLNKLVFLRDH